MIMPEVTRVRIMPFCTKDRSLESGVRQPAVSRGSVHGCSFSDPRGERYVLDRNTVWKGSMNSFQSLIYKPADGVGLPNLQVLDQLLLPREKAYMDVKNVQDAWKVRGSYLS